MTRAEQATAYLDALICAAPVDSHHLELRWRGDGKPMRSEWFVEPDGLQRGANPAALAPIAERAVALADQGGEVFAGVGLRTRAEGTKDAVPMLGLAWADCDSLDATARLGSFPFRPSMTVRSSPGKVHAYFRLEQPHPTEVVEDVNRRLALALGACPHVADAARILRVPGTYHTKTGRPQNVSLYMNRPTVTPLADLLTLPAPQAAAPAPTTTGAPVAGPRSDDLDDLRAIPATVYVPLLTGREVGRDGKACCPVHGGGAERSASLHAYPDAERGWFCYGCSKGGDVLDLVAHMTGLDTRVDFPQIVSIARSHLGGGR
ncbi:MAG: phage/plasmid primase, family [Solirubrobacterales bacterium]|nr:phage/plasmid primase, family [Solirubrobacterales bacterium]